MRPPAAALAALAVFAAASQGPAFSTAPAGLEARTVFLSPRGDDTFSGLRRESAAGRTDGPKATLEGARDGVRKLRAQGLEGSFRILVADGTYALTRPVVFGPEDGDTTIEAEGGAMPVFTAGVVVKGFQRREDGLWEAPLPDGVPEDVEPVWVGGRRAVRARTPNEGYLTIRGQDPARAAPGPGGEPRRTAFLAGEAETALLSRVPKERLARAVAVVFHRWETSRQRVESVDAATSRVVLAGLSRWSFMTLEAGQRYVLENFPEALDAPGEYLADGGKLLYLPRPGESLETAEAVVPVAESLVEVRGEPGRKVAGLAFRGLSFRHAAYRLPPGGITDVQAAESVPAAVTVDYGRGVAFEGCEIAQVGPYGLWLRRGNHLCRVERTRVADLGAGGIRIGPEGANRTPAPADVTRATAVRDCVVEDGGHLFAGAVGIWVSHASDSEVVHNEVSRFRYTGISAGWHWGFKKTAAKRNLIARNHVFAIGGGGLDDLAGIYTLGPSEGTRIAGNVVHDVTAHDNGRVWAWGIYNDEGTTGVAVEGNTVFTDGAGAYHLHYGRDVTLRDNVLVSRRAPPLQLSSAKGTKRIRLERNVIAWDSGLAGSGPFRAADVAFSRSVFAPLDGSPAALDGATLEALKAEGRDEGSVVADPGFVSPGARDYRLRPDSPARALGVAPADPCGAGPRVRTPWCPPRSPGRVPGCGTP